MCAYACVCETSRKKRTRKIISYFHCYSSTHRAPLYLSVAWHALSQLILVAHIWNPSAIIQFIIDLLFSSVTELFLAMKLHDPGNVLCVCNYMNANFIIYHELFWPEWTHYHILLIDGVISVVTITMYIWSLSTYSTTKWCQCASHHHFSRLLVL